MVFGDLFTHMKVRKKTEKEGLKSPSKIFNSLMERKRKRWKQISFSNYSPLKLSLQAFVSLFNLENVYHIVISLNKNSRIEEWPFHFELNNFSGIESRETSHFKRSFYLKPAMRSICFNSEPSRILRISSVTGKVTTLIHLI